MNDNSLQDYFGSLSHQKHQRAPLKAKPFSAPINYFEIYGKRAEMLAKILMDKKEIDTSAHPLFGYYEHHSFLRLSCEMGRYKKDIMVYPDKSVIFLNTDFVKGRVKQDVFSADGTMQCLDAKWNSKKNCYSSDFRPTLSGVSSEKAFDELFDVIERTIYDLEKFITSPDPNVRPDSFYEP